MEIAVVACTLSAVFGVLAADINPGTGAAVSISIIGAFIIYYLKKISEK